MIVLYEMNGLKKVPFVFYCLQFLWIVLFLNMCQ